MGTKPENAYIDKLNNLLPIKRRRKSMKARAKYPEAQHVHYEKMNNPYSSGTADGWYSAVRDLWVEYKYLPKLTVRASVHPEKLLSVLQLDWLRERYKEGRAVWVIIGCPEGGVLLTDLRWENELSAQDFRSLILSNDELARRIMSQLA